MSKAVKQRVKDAVSFIGAYEAAIVRYAERYHVQGVLCGHIHSPTVRQIGATTYYNCGDWVENCSALVEQEDGRIELLCNLQQPSLASSTPPRRDGPTAPVRARDIFMKKKHKNPPETSSDEISPARSLLADLVSLRRILRRTSRAYLRRLETELDEVTAWATKRAQEGNLPRAGLRDLGDMITLVRQIGARPEKGRRRDLKKIDATVSNLRELIENQTIR